MDSRASANSVCIPLKSALPEAEVIAGYGAKCARTFSACRQCVSEAEKGPGSAGPFRRDGFGTMNRDRVPRWRKSASGLYKQKRPRATSLMPKQTRDNPTLLTKTPKIAKPFTRVKLFKNPQFLKAF